MSMPELPRNPCAIFGLTLPKGAETIAGILVSLKSTYLMAVLSGWAALKLGWQHWPFNNNPVTENIFLQDLWVKMPWLLIDASLSFVNEWILLVGIWRKDKTMCHVWMCTNMLKGFRAVFLGPKRSIGYLLFGICIGFYEYWVIWAYSEELEREEMEGDLIPEPMSMSLNIMCILVFLLEVYIIFWNPIGMSPVIIFMSEST